MSRTILSNARITTVLSGDTEVILPLQASGDDEPPTTPDVAPVPLEPEREPDELDGEEDQSYPSEPEREDDVQPEDEILAPAALSLDDDPETSLVASIYLHLLSEHHSYGALRLDEIDAEAIHAQLHTFGADHAAFDWRFRPQRALKVALRTPIEPGIETPSTD